MGGNNLSKLHKFNGWQCDSCGELIASIDAGWVEWLSSEGDRGVEVLSGLQLVHGGSVLPNGQGKTCRYDCLKEFRNSKTIVEGLPLERFVGPDGLMMLFSFLAAGNLPQEEILELAKRVQIPGYELARRLLQESSSSKVVRPLLGHGCYLQSEIHEMIVLALNNRCIVEPRT
jgi:hypothetical protein